MKKKPAEPFTLYTQGMRDEQRAALQEYLRDAQAHIALPRVATMAMMEDIKAALLYYDANGVPLEEALRRLDARRLGGFYVRPPVAWYALDDAAKIYPLSMKRGRMELFRLAVYLKEPIVPELLQMALSFTIKRFPSFATTVKKGFFWHYLDAAKRRYAVHPEKDIPCMPITVSQSGSQSFRVMYYHNRISLEFFHVLTDGAGGMAFLKALTAEYLRLRGVEIPPCEAIMDVNADPLPQETANEFKRAGLSGKASGFMNKPAVQMSGRISHYKPCRVLHIRVDADKLAACARAKGVTVTAYVLSLLMVANRHATDDTQGEISIQVPVNMRRYYPSVTVRNFSLYCSVRLPVTEVNGVDSVLAPISAQLKEKTSPEAMGEMIKATERLITALQYVPLIAKTPVAGVVYGFLSDQIFSNTLSNLGRVALPAEMEAHIACMDFMLCPGITNRASCALVTCANVATLSVTKITLDPSFEEKLMELFASDGLEPVIEGSDLYEN